MISKGIALTDQQQKSEKPQMGGILQRVAVRPVSDAGVQSTDDLEAQALSNSAFPKDFSQVPISTTKPQQFQVINSQRHPLPPIQAKLTIGEPNDRAIQREREMTGNSQVSSEVPHPNKTGLPDRLKTGIENLSGYLMDNVRVHYNSAKPAQLQAHAYAQGKDIYVASGQEKHLPHEGWHVVQQMQGRVKPTIQTKEVSLNDNAVLEREADVMGAKALKMPENSRRILVQGGNASGTVQRYLIVGNKDYTRTYKEDAAKITGTDQDTEIAKMLNQLITQIASKMIQALNGNDTQELKVIQAIKSDADGKLRKQITKWIENKVGDEVGKNPDFGRKNQTRVYTDYKDLALALYGWVNAKVKRHEEKVEAEKVQSNDAISYHLDSILLKIKSGMDNHPNKASEIATDMANPETGVNGHRWNLYQNHFNLAGKGNHTKLPANYTQVLANPEHYDVREKTGILHDIMHYFMEKGEVDSTLNILAMPSMKATVIDDSSDIQKREDYKRPENSQIWDEHLDGNKLVNLQHIPGNSNSVKVSNEESHATYKYARLNDLPMYGRHSFTAARMMTMVRSAGGTKEQISAIAWAIMSYWRKNYDHTSIPYHTLHEIMDFAPEFGIAYNPKDRLKGLEDFTNHKFIATLQQGILYNPIDRDIDKLIAKDSKKNVAEFFLANEALWKNAKVRNFLKTTVLPNDEFFKLNSQQLYQFFNYNNETKAILPLLPGERQKYVKKIDI